MKDGRTFYIEMEGYDEKPEIKILIGVDIFVDENGEILAEIKTLGMNKEILHIMMISQSLKFLLLKVKSMRIRNLILQL